jgi:hypothetical protein
MMPIVTPVVDSVVDVADVVVVETLVARVVVSSAAFDELSSSLLHAAMPSTATTRSGARRPKRISAPARAAR